MGAEGQDRKEGERLRQVPVGKLPKRAEFCNSRKTASFKINNREKEALGEALYHAKVPDSVVSKRRWTAEDYYDYVLPALILQFDRRMDGDALNLAAKVMSSRGYEWI